MFIEALALGFVLLAVVLLFFVAFFIPSNFLKKGKYLVSEPNVLPGRTLENPCVGVTSVQYDYLLGIDGKIPEAKAKSKAVAKVEEGHHHLVLGFILFCKKRQKLIPFATAYYACTEPFRMEDEAEFVFPKKTAGIAMITRELDDEKFIEKPLAKLPLGWVLLFAFIGGLGITLSALAVYTAILIMFGRWNFMSYIQYNIPNMIMTGSCTLALGFLVEFLFLFFFARKKGYRGK